MFTRTRYALCPSTQGDRLEFDEPKLRASEAHVVGLLREAAEQGRPFDGLMGFSQVRARLRHVHLPVY